MKIRILFVLFFSASIAISAYADESAESSPSAVGSQQLQGFNLNGYDNKGDKTWDVNGAKADISDNNIQITNVDANLYGKEEANLTADHGTINKTNGNVNLKDNVVITSKDRGTQMTTPWIGIEIKIWLVLKILSKLSMIRRWLQVRECQLIQI